ncbi:hypothetical protein AUC71_07610 [Methyloceanibacter marginalis]|uniref:Uncharacterized protein n=1 Tax=Methyloceanibacter marginalis TaxID=1774971 RepID=A0A1E3WDD0_9HYPH|nr:hypothetical protein AUC71_07610 [Methyloceanibacter marginalis]
MLGAAQRLHRFVARELAVGARAPPQDRAGMGHLGRAAEIGGILRQQVEQLFEEMREWHHGALAEIDHALLDAVALRPPAVLADEERWIVPPALVLPPQR